MRASAEMSRAGLPFWWARENARVLAHETSVADAIDQACADFDDEAIGDRLCRCRFAIVDSFLGPEAAAAIRAGVVGMERRRNLSSCPS